MSHRFLLGPKDRPDDSCGFIDLYALIKGKYLQFSLAFLTFKSTYKFVFVNMRDDELLNVDLF